MDEIKELWIRSTADGSMQPSLFREAEGENRPMMVVLHTWSFDRHNQTECFLPHAKRLNWHLLLPEFRGPNLARNPFCEDACASRKAKQDILDAVEYVSAHYRVDDTQIFLLGGSGGAHMTLMMCGAAPKLWRCAAAYNPITDLSLWHKQCLAAGAGYAKDVEACMGDRTPQEAPEEYIVRSPIGYMDRIAQSNLKIYHGKYDPVVPVIHSIEFYARLQNQYPKSRVFLEIFDGGHEARVEDSLVWIQRQLNNKSFSTLTG